MTALLSVAMRAVVEVDPAAPATVVLLPEPAGTTKVGAGRLASLVSLVGAWIHAISVLLVQVCY